MCLQRSVKALKVNFDSSFLISLIQKILRHQAHKHKNMGHKLNHVNNKEILLQMKNNYLVNLASLLDINITNKELFKDNVNLINMLM